MKIKQNHYEQRSHVCRQFHLRQELVKSLARHGDHETRKQKRSEKKTTHGDKQEKHKKISKNVRRTIRILLL